MTESTVLELVDQEKNVIEKAIRRWGCAVSEAILDLDCSIYQIPQIEGFIGYRLISGCAVVYGSPVCAPNHVHQLAKAFQEYCKEKKWNYIYIIVNKEFSQWGIKNICNVMIEVGEELIFNPKNDPTEGHRGHRLRNKINHALHEGLKVHEYTQKDPALEQSMHDAGEAWLKARKGPQIYLGKMNFFNIDKDRRCFYVMHQNRVVGAALLCRLEAQRGWLLKYLIATPTAPRGTSELLMNSLLETLRGEGCHYITYGMVPSSRLGEIAGLGKFVTWIASWTFQLSKLIFNLNQRKTYWLQFLPKTEPAYLLFSSPKLRFQEISAVMKALKIKI